MVDINGLRALLSLARCGSVAAAADELGFTPSAVSQQLKKLQSDVGVPLLVKKGRGVQLTAHGVALTEHAQSVFDLLESATTAARDASVHAHGAVRVGAFATANRALIIPLLPTLQAQAPEVSLTGIEVNPEQCVQMVSRGIVDVGVVHNWDRVPLHLPSDLAYDFLGHDTAGVLVPENSTVAAMPSVSADDLKDFDWVTHQGIEVCRAMYNQLFSDAPYLPKVVFESDEYATQYELVRSGVALAIFPRLATADEMPGTVWVPIHPTPPRRGVLAVWRKTMSASGAMLAVRNLLRSRAGEVLEAEGA